MDEPGRGKEEPNGALPVHLDTPSALVTAQHKNLTSLTLTARVLFLRTHRLQVAWPQSYDDTLLCTSISAGRKY